MEDKFYKLKSDIIQLHDQVSDKIAQLPEKSYNQPIFDEYYALHDAFVNKSYLDNLEAHKNKLFEFKLRLTHLYLANQ